MVPDNDALFATIILLLPMVYFLLAAPDFLLVRLDIPQVAQLLRAMFSGYFLTVAIAGIIGTFAVAVTGRLGLAVGIGLIAAFAASSRSTVMRTSSDPARARAATWSTVAAMSAVSVLVMDCTTHGAPPPTWTLPTMTGTDWRRGVMVVSVFMILPSF